MNASFYALRLACCAALAAGCLVACGGKPERVAAGAAGDPGVFALDPAQRRGWSAPAGENWTLRWIEHLERGSREGQRFALEELGRNGAVAGPALAAEVRAATLDSGRFAYLVNLLTALGASGDAAQWPVLAEVLRTHPTPVVRTTAGETAARLRPPELLPDLIAALQRETESAPRRAMLTAIARIGGPAAIAELEGRVRAWLTSAVTDDTGEAWNALMLVEGGDLLPTLIRLDAALPPPLRVQALIARLELGDRSVGEAVTEYTDPERYPSAKTRSLALTALAELGAWQQVLACAQDPDPAVPRAIARLLSLPNAVAAGAGVDQLDAWLSSSDPELARAALVALVAHGQRHRLDPWLQAVREFPLRSGSTEALLLVTRDELLDPRLPAVLLACWDQAEGEHRLDLMRALTRTGAPAAVERLAQTMLDERAEPEVRRLAAALIANFPSSTGPLQAWYAQNPSAARAADLVAGLGRRPQDPESRAILLGLAADDAAPDAARKVVLDALPKLFGFEACALLLELQAGTRRVEVRAYLEHLLVVWF
jgi:hypothetical protein